MRLIFCQIKATRIVKRVIYALQGEGMRGFAIESEGLSRPQRMMRRQATQLHMQLAGFDARHQRHCPESGWVCCKVWLAGKNSCA
ncbi:hypothetical protein SFMTTN_0908 [Sulfuriferula multivorans]|uniref:Uncharacterized protein n=1 Tax=Sulfuriferula multivorans TaxID=1559896 RepID=A0A401JC12_9PROT|nr:hypothetical protein [Sulfuriferula multivorans]GBL45104.1 hypothetical protein SFMTTN_0908 [Sulfuriferula multivorans]